MRYFQRIAAIFAVAALALPSVAFADVAVKSCCILLSESTVNSCFQFTDVLPGSPSEDEKSVMRNFQQYKCLNVPQHYVNYQGQTANWIVNDANNSGVCGTATTRSATCATVNSTPLTAHARCETEADCGAGTAYACEENFCKLKEGQLCSGDSGTQVNCANGLACRPTDGSKKCLADVATSSGVSESADSGEAPFVPIVPVLGVEIPGFSFTPATESGGIVSVPYLGQYVNALYRYLTAIVLTVAIVMVVYGGFQYLLAATPLGVKNGKKTITDALIGMGLVLGAYVILNTVNPALLSLKSLEFERVDPAEFFVSEDGFEYDEAGEPASAPGNFATAGSSRPGQFVTVDRSIFRGLDTDCVHLNTPVDPDLIEPLRRAGEIFCRTRTDSSWRIIGGGERRSTLSASLWIQRCIKKQSCTVPIGPPFESGVYGRDSQGRFTFTDPTLRSLVDALPEQTGAYSQAQIANIYRLAAPLAGVRGDNAHGRGLAMDLYCGGASTRHGLIRSIPCQILLEQAMKQAGFCRIPNEWWHFELASKSSSRSCDPNWTIGSVTITSPSRTDNYGSCTGSYSFERLKAGGNGCR